MALLVAILEADQHMLLCMRLEAKECEQSIGEGRKGGGGRIVRAVVDLGSNHKGWHSSGKCHDILALLPSNVRRASNIVGVMADPVKASLTGYTFIIAHSLMAWPGSSMAGCGSHVRTNQQSEVLSPTKK